MLNKKGFSLIELLAAVSVFGLCIAILVSYVSVELVAEREKAGCLSASFLKIQSALKAYSSAKGAFPDPSCSTVSETCLPQLVPHWLPSVPSAQSCLESLRNSFYYSNTNGVYLCVKTQAAADKTAVRVFSLVKQRQPDGKVYLNTHCGATSDDSIEGKEAALTWWVIK